ncbi:MAG: glycoside hydrolase family 65 protein [Flavobacteriaceae bacterium]
MLKNKYVLDPWSIIEDKFDSTTVVDSESVFSLGNGKIGQRGNFEEDFSGNQSIGNYISGIYYKDKTKVGWWKKGYPDYFAKMVNCPNWNTIRIEINNKILDLNKCEVFSYRRELNMMEGWCERKVKFETPEKEKIKIVSKKFICLERENIGVIKYSITSLNKKIKIKILPSIDINIKNNDANWNQPFIETIGIETNDNYSKVNSKVINSDFQIATFFKTKYFINSNEVRTTYNKSNVKNLIGSSSEFDLNTNDELSLLKIGGYVNSNDTNFDEFENLIQKELKNSIDLGFENLLNENSKAWNKIWKDSDIVIDGDIMSQQGIRFNIFQLNQTFNGNDPKLNIGPKGFTGEKYGGVTYWDTEAYCIPFYLGTKKSIVAKNLLNQRYNQLPNAILNAEKIGLNHGAALYPMVTANGEECHNEWEITFEEIHRNAAIVQAIKKYLNFTDDFEFVNKKAIKILIAISRFWSQRVNYSNDLNKYVILGVTGPNEYENNVDNNWYTNYSAKWCLEYTIETLNKILKSEKNTYNKVIIETSLEKMKSKNGKKLLTIFICHIQKI